MINALNGVVMELQDCAMTLVKGQKTPCTVERHHYDKTNSIEYVPISKIEETILFA